MNRKEKQEERQHLLSEFADELQKQLIPAVYSKAEDGNGLEEVAVMFNDLGEGDGKNGVLLLLSMEERDYALAGHGDLGETICGYESSYVIEDAFLETYRDNIVCIWGGWDANQVDEGYQIRNYLGGWYSNVCEYFIGQGTFYCSEPLWFRRKKSKNS